MKRRILFPLSDEALARLAHLAKEQGRDPRELGGELMEQSLMTTKTTERTKLVAEGRKLFDKIGDKVNVLTERTIEEYRRECDFEEVCIALALLARDDPRLTPPAANKEVFTTDDRQHGPI